VLSQFSSIPTYFLSLFSIRFYAAGKLEAIQRSFLWGSFGSDFMYHLAKYYQAPVTQEGLAVRDLRLFNEAFLDKWLWRFMNEKCNLWRKVVANKYGEVEFGWFSSTPNVLMVMASTVGVFMDRVPEPKEVSVWVPKISGRKDGDPCLNRKLLGTQ